MQYIVKFEKVKFLYLSLIFCFNFSISYCQDEENPLPYQAVNPKYDEAPIFSTNEKSLSQYIADSIRYPEKEKIRKKEGCVMLKFTITKKGKIINIQALNGTPGAPDFVKEAIRLLESMPLWIPAKLKGKDVDAEYYLSIPFKLKSQEKNSF
jgi:TonB family protein